MPKNEKPEVPTPPSKPSLAAKKALKSLRSFLLFEEIFQDEAGRRFRRLLRWMAQEGEVDLDKGRRRYGHMWLALGERTGEVPGPRVGNLFQSHFLERLLEDANLFHRRAEKMDLSQIGPSLTRLYELELAELQKILKADWEAEFLKRAGLLGKGEVPSLVRVHERPGDKGTNALQAARTHIKERILGGSGNVLVEEIADHFHANGWGFFGRYRAFRWKATGEGGYLDGVEYTDPIRLEQLVGYDEQRKPLIENTEAFVAGKGGNHVLLYGERGTGKSSTVKALLNSYQDRGLRLVEVAAADLKDFHLVLKQLRGRREKFILFVDDLSFEENETSYKGLKAVLEGDVEAVPDNVILMATSNRRHLIREFFEDRAGGVQKDGEIHGADTVEEKLSLSDRFGLVISFYSPDQATYLRMVDNWAKAEKIKMPAEELHRRALEWEKSNNVRSGRTARQFINDLKGKF